MGGAGCRTTGARATRRGPRKKGSCSLLQVANAHKQHRAGPLISLRQIRAPSQCTISLPPLFPLTTSSSSGSTNRAPRSSLPPCRRPFPAGASKAGRQAVLHVGPRRGDGGGVMRFQSRSFSSRARRARSQPSSSLSLHSRYSPSPFVFCFSPLGTLGVWIVCAN